MLPADTLWTAWRGADRVRSRASGRLAVAWKIMKVGRDDQCTGCGVAVPAGSTAVWFSGEKRVRCVECAAAYTDPDPAADDAARAVPSVQGVATPELSLPKLAASPAAQAPLDRPKPDLAAGETVQQWADRSAAKDLQRDRKRIESFDAKQAESLENHRLTGKLRNILMEPPTTGVPSRSTVAKQKGAEGERIVGAALVEVAGIEVIFSRLQPGRPKADIDCIVVAPTGIWVEDAKNHEGRIDNRNAGGLFRPDWRLTVGGRDKTVLVGKVHEQVDGVRSVLGDDAFATVPIHGALCFADANWGWPRMAFQVKDVAIMWPAKLAEMVSTPGNFVAMVPAIAEHLRSVLTPAG